MSAFRQFSTFASLLDATGVTYTLGNIVVANGTKLTVLARGTIGQVLTATSGGIIWADPSGGGGGGTWGTITGTLADQTDLATALSGKVATTITVNGHALSANVTVTKSDLSLENVENTALSTWVGSTAITTVGILGSSIGIGETALEKLQVAGAIRSTSNATDFSSADGINVDYVAASKLGRVAAYSADETAELVFYTGHASEAMRLDGSGNATFAGTVVAGNCIISDAGGSLSLISADGASGRNGYLALNAVNQLLLRTNGNNAFYCQSNSAFAPNGLTIGGGTAIASSGPGGALASGAFADAVIADTGWTANSNVGDKTAVVPAYTAVSCMGSDTVSQTDCGALSAQVALLTLKLQALETALSAKLLPNA